MVQFSKNFRKNLAIDLRKKGFSYSEIAARVPVAKSTMSYWFRDLFLTENQTENLKNRQLKIARDNIHKKNSRTLERIEEVKNSSANDIKEISKKEFWLMGVMLYWRYRNEANIKKGVSFASSDPQTIKFFLKWLREIGQLKNEEIKFDIFLKRNQKETAEAATKHWEKISCFDKISPHIYYQKEVPKKIIKKGTKNKDKIKNKIPRRLFGILRIRIKASSLLARQLAGWITGIQKSMGII